MDASDLQERLQDLVGMGAAVPWHAVGRLHMLIAGDEPVFLDARLTPDESGVCSGRIVVLTGDRVILAVLDHAMSHPRSNEGPSYSVNATAWARSELSSVEIVGDLENGFNPDDRWLMDYGDLWPHDAKVTLHFNRLPTLTLPLADEPSKELRRHFRNAILPALLEDL